MNQFQLYFRLGLEQIINFKSFDHILFIIVLCAIYLLRDYKKILVLILVFTAGHSIALSLSALRIISIDSAIIEFLIPVTIAVTAFFNILKPKPSNSTGIQANYLFALFFGLIHGMGFSTYLRSLIGKEGTLFQPLLAFNLGLGVGQLIVVGIFLLCSSVMVGIMGTNRKEWTLVISAVVLGMSLMMMSGSKFW